MTLPQSIGRFQVEAIIGSGGFATVYRAYDPTLKRRVALKTPHPHLLAEPGFLARFAQEAQLAAGLSHPHIVTIYEVGEQDGLPFIAMELLDGLPLDRWLDKARPAAGQVWETLAQVGQALDHAHSKGIVHRDVKPANVLVTSGRGAVLSDFGIARSFEASASLTGAIIGTPAYMAPEQAQGLPVSAATDVYALAVMLYEIVAGRRPFTGDTPVAMLNQHATKPPPDPRAFQSNIPPAAAALLLQGLDKSPAARPRSAEQFARGVGAGLGALAKEGGAPLAAGSALPAAKPPRRSAPARRASWVIPALAALILVATIFLILRSRGAPPTAAPSQAVAAVTAAPTAQPVARAVTTATRVRPTATALPTLAPQPTAPLGGANLYIEYILDGSNSMREKVGGETKLALAQRVLGEHLRQQPADTNFGLRVYGHRAHYTDRAQSCQDVELVAPIAPGQGERIAQWLVSMQAQGLSSVGLALRQAAADFIAEPGRVNRIVLIGDGTESCGVDPCAEARRLKAVGIALLVDVIGLDVADDAEAELKCVAQQSGGQYQSARSATDLKIALSQVTHLPEQLPPPAASPDANAAQPPAPEVTAAPTAFPSATFSPSPTTAPQVVVQGSAVNLRSGPGLIYPIIAQVKAGVLLTVLARYGEKIDGGVRTWYEVCCAAGGIRGWVAASAVSDPGVAVPTASVVPPTPQPTRRPPTATLPPPPTATPIPPTPVPPSEPKPPEPDPGKPPVPTPVP